MKINSLEIIDSANEIDIANDRLIVEKKGKTYQIGVKALVDRIDTKSRQVTKTSWVFLGPNDVVNILGEKISITAGSEIKKTVQVANFSSIAVPASCRRVMCVADAENLTLFSKYRGFFRLAFAVKERVKIIFILENIQDPIIETAESTGLNANDSTKIHNQLMKGLTRTVNSRKDIVGPLTARGKIPSYYYPNKNMEEQNKVSINLVAQPEAQGILHSIKILAWSY